MSLLTNDYNVTPPRSIPTPLPAHVLTPHLAGTGVNTGFFLFVGLGCIVVGYVLLCIALGMKGRGKPGKGNGYG
jgi:uncharacterized membrane protein